MREQGFSYNQALVNSIKDGDCLEGYWQTEKYHEPVRQSLLDIFTPKRPLGSQSKRLAEEILALGHKSVSIHVRRSDYLRPPHCGYHNILDMEHYYLPAIQKVLEKVEDAWFFVFSDDPEWCRANFAPVASVHQKFWIVDHNRPGGPLFGSSKPGMEHEDLWLMALCHNSIIANSSFSWWGTWLRNIHTDGTVIAPQHWFGPVAKLDESDIVPDRWTRI